MDRRSRGLSLNLAPSKGTTSSTNKAGIPPHLSRLSCKLSGYRTWDTPGLLFSCKLSRAPLPISGLKQYVMAFLANERRQGRGPIITRGCYHLSQIEHRNRALNQPYHFRGGSYRYKKELPTSKEYLFFPSCRKANLVKPLPDHCQLALKSTI